MIHEIRFNINILKYNEAHSWCLVNIGRSMDSPLDEDERYRWYGYGTLTLGGTVSAIFHFKDPEMVTLFALTFAE